MSNTKNHNPDVYTAANVLAKDIENELIRLQRWELTPLPKEKFVDMGAFGSYTMSFEQWLQFVLLPRIQAIIEEKDNFPSGSMVSTYAVRVFDGDSEAATLQSLLSQLDQLVNGDDVWAGAVASEEEMMGEPSVVSVGDTTLPPVLFTLAELLPQFHGDDLESQLQTFDTFLNVLSPTAFETIRQLLLQAAEKTTNPESKKRLADAAQSAMELKPLAKPYSHEEAMKKYREDFQKSFPSK